MKKWWVFSLVLLWACDDVNECGVSTYSEEVYIAFHDITTKATRQVKFETMEVHYASGETIVFEDESEEGSSSYALPLDVSASSTSFVFSTETIDYDFVLDYRTTALIENPDCGPTVRISGVNASSVAFDSVAVITPILSKNIGPHVEIYF